ATDLTVTASSSNTSLVDNSNIVIEGTDASRTISITPTVNEYGVVTITISIFDGNLTATTAFVLTINNMLEISAIDDQTTLEDTATGPISFTLTGVSSAGATIDYSFEYTFGTMGSGADQFNMAKDVALDSSGNIYVADYGTHSIKVFSSPGTFSYSVGTGSSGSGPYAFEFPNAIHIDQAGKIYVVDQGSNSIKIYTSSFVFDYSITTGSPYDVSVDSSGNIYVADNSSGGEIKVYSSDGNYNTSLCADHLNMPKAVAVDTSGKIYVVDNESTTDYVKVFSSSGEIEYTIGTSTSGTADGQLEDPSGVDVDSSGNIFVADTMNQRIQIFNSSGSFEYSIGTVGVYGSAAGQFDSPNNVFLDSNGNLYVAEMTRIQKFTNNAQGGLTVSASSSYTPLVPDANITLSGSGSSRTIDILPAPEQSGTVSITVTATDGDLTATTVFTLTVTAVNDAPVISSISNYTTAEDTTIDAITFTATDVDSASCALDVTLASSDQSLVLNTNLSYICDADNYTITAIPETNQNGLITITVTVADNGGLTAATAFDLSITSVNDRPVITSDTTWTLNEDETASFTLTATDIETADCNLTLTYTSSNTGLLSSDSISYTCLSDVYYITITPTTNQSGNLTLTFTASDADTLSTTQAITITVINVNDPPIITGAISNQTSLTLTDSEGGILTITAISSDDAMVPNSTINLAGSGINSITINASAGIPQSLTMIYDQISSTHGKTAITVSVSDSEGLSDTFEMTVLISPPGSGNMLYLVDADDRIEIPDAPSLDVVENCTFEFWFKLFSLSSTEQYIFIKDAAYMLTVTNTKIIFNNWSNNYNLNSTALSPNTWYHVAVVIDGAYGCRIFVNGLEQSYQTGSTLGTASTNSLKIGYYSSALNGYIDEFRIWSVPRTQTQIRDNMCKRLNGNETGLSAYYRFDHSTGTTLLDMSPNNNNGTMSNMDSSQWIPSEAPIGDDSVYDYTGSIASDFEAVYAHSDGDRFTATGESGGYTALHVYMVNIYDDFDASIVGWYTLDTNRYFGVFPAAINGTFSATYSYTGNTYVNGKTTLKSAIRVNNSQDWSRNTQLLDLTNGKLELSQQTRSEYILGDGITPPEISSLSDLTSAAIDEPIRYSVSVSDAGTVTITVSASDLSLISNINLCGSGNDQLVDTFTANSYKDITLTFDQSTTNHGRVTITVVAETEANASTSTFAVIVSPPGSGNALNFDGTDDYIALPSISWINGDFTCEAWIYLRSHVQGTRLIDFGNGAPSDNVVLMFMGTGPIQLQVFDGGSQKNFSPNYIIPLFQWIHIAYKIEGTTATFYVNGEEKDYTNDIYSPNNVTRTSNYIAKSNWSNAYPDVVFDEIRFWNTARTETELRENMCKKLAGNETGLMAYYRFDHISGTTLADLTGNGNDGTLTNMSDASWITSSAALGDDSAYDYAGSIVSDFSVSIAHSDGDQFTATGDGGTYTGIHVYLVNESPNSTAAPQCYTSMDTDHYYGVFPVGISPTYSIAYNYSGNTYASDDSNLQVAYRTNNAGSWTGFVSTQYTSTTTLVKTGIAAFSGISATEFTLGKNEPPIMTPSTGIYLAYEDTLFTTSYTITDSESSPCEVSLTMLSSNPNLITDSNFSYICNADSYTIQLLPSADMYGEVTITIIATDLGGNTASQSFSLSVAEVNDAPTIGSIADQTTLEDIATGIINLTATDIDTDLANLTLTMSSSDQTLIPDEYLIHLSNAGQYSIVVTPLQDQYGTATITVTITDPGGLTASTSFGLTVTDLDDSIYMWANNQSAVGVLLQPDFTSNSYGTTDSIGYYPTGVAVDPITGKVFISERMNNRILRFSSSAAYINGSSAEAVFGQADFTSGSVNRGGSTAANSLNSPECLFIDSFGHLWVADRTNHRVLRFDNAGSKASDPNADAVFGQTDFTSNISNITQYSMNSPVGIWVDPAGSLWVADNLNNRIIRFDDIYSKTNGANADAVLGQPDFVTNASGTTQNKMFNPHGIYGDAQGTVFVAEFSNNRVLRFDNAASKANGANADVVLGQLDFTSNAGSVAANNLNKPVSAIIDHMGKLYVSDLGNNRILLFNDVLSVSNGTSADNVLGQSDFTINTANTGGISERSLYKPQWLFFDKLYNDLWVPDFENHRVLRYRMMLKNPPTIGVISDSTMDEDTVSTAISFTVTDINEQTLTITYNTSDTSLISTSGITFSGDQVSTNGTDYTVSATAVAETVTLTITPESNQSGTLNITITVTDPDGMTATQSFSLTINEIDDAPIFASSAETAGRALEFTYTVSETSSVALTITSSDPSLIDDSSINVDGTGLNNNTYATSANGIQSIAVKYTPVANAHGRVTLTVTAS
ncbi:MAG: tandem-95 repeat protein, partial [Candidatus Magnetomorum sp.]|nr:tandem-95 repeat protein [Candidatus Magnetomorum sp.]